MVHGHPASLPWAHKPQLRPESQFFSQNYAKFLNSEFQINFFPHPYTTTPTHPNSTLLLLCVESCVVVNTTYTVEFRSGLGQHSTQCLFLVLAFRTQARIPPNINSIFFSEFWSTLALAYLPPDSTCDGHSAKPQLIHSVFWTHFFWRNKGSHH